jgi:hypothetical protein
LLVALALPTIATAAWAQTPDATFSVDYYAQINGGSDADATVRITNPGAQGGSSPDGDLCALLYVFTADQEMAECCGCPVTPNGLRTLSVTRDLASNPLTGDKPTTGALKLLSSTRSPGGICDPASPTPTPSLVAWATHLQTWGHVTETAFEPAALSDEERDKLVRTCGGIEDNGSGFGVCTCGFEEPPAPGPTSTSTTVPKTNVTTTTKPWEKPGPTSTSTTVPKTSVTTTTRPSDGNQGDDEDKDQGPPHPPGKDGHWHH